MNDWMEVKLQQIKGMGEAVVSGFVPDDIAEKRYSVCLECDYFKNKKCKLCSCYMPAKVLFKIVECPKNYWGE